MGKLLMALLCLATVMMGLTVGLFQMLGWKGLLIAFVGMVVLGMFLKSLAGKIIKNLFMAPFRMKGSVLRGAKVKVHSIEPAIAPYVEQSEEDEEPPRRFARYAHVDLTITPAAGSGEGFTMWEPGELVLARPGEKAEDFESDNEPGSIEKLQIWEEGAWVEDEGMKYPGPQRLRLLVGFDEDIRRVQLRYYFELFGDIELGMPLHA